MLAACHVITICLSHFQPGWRWFPLDWLFLRGKMNESGDILLGIGHGLVRVWFYKNNTLVETQVHNDEPPYHKKSCNSGIMNIHNICERRSKAISISKYKNQPAMVVAVPSARGFRARFSSHYSFSEKLFRFKLKTNLSKNVCPVCKSSTIRKQ